MNACNQHSDLDFEIPVLTENGSAAGQDKWQQLESIQMLTRQWKPKDLGHANLEVSLPHGTAFPMETSADKVIRAEQDFQKDGWKRGQELELRVAQEEGPCWVLLALGDARIRNWTQLQISSPFWIMEIQDPKCPHPPSRNNDKPILKEDQQCPPSSVFHTQNTTSQAA